MKKKFLTIVFAILSLLILVPSIGFSLWFFIDNPSNPDIEINTNAGGVHSGIDDVKENYTGIKEKGKTYDIYFFPSTLYTQYYYNYLANSDYLLDVEQDQNGNVVMPEDLFGYIEVDSSLNKNFIYEKDGTSTSNPLSSSDTSKGDLAYINYVFNNFDINRDRNVSGFYQDYSQLAASYVQYSEEDFINGDASNGLDDYHYTWDYASRDFGDPNDLTLPVYYYYQFQYKWTYLNGREHTDNYNNYFQTGKENYNKSDGQFNYRNIYRYDRFGCWSDKRVNFSGDNYTIDKTYKDSNGSIVSQTSDPNPLRFNGTVVDIGRYIPVKITVTDALPVNLYESAIAFPESSMGDRNKRSDDAPNAWYNYSFGGWGYFDDKNNFSISGIKNDGNNINFLTDSFTTLDCTGLFDIMKNLEEFAVYNSNTDTYEIRLFPIYSNGKDYQYVGDTIKSGLRDGLKLNFSPLKNLEPMVFDAGESDRPVQGPDGDVVRRAFDNMNKTGQAADATDYLIDYYFTYDLKNQNDVDIETARISNFRYNHESYHQMNVQIAFLDRGDSWFDYDINWDGNWLPSDGSLNLMSGYIANPILNENGTINRWDSSNLEHVFASDGLYNIYIFVHNNLQYPSTGYDDYSHYVYDNLEKLYPGKNITIVDFNGSSDGGIVQLQGNTNYVIGVERIIEAKFIQDVPLESDETLLTQNVKNAYDNSLNLLKQNERIELVSDSVNEKLFKFGQGIVENHKVINDFSYESIINSLNKQLINNESIYLIKNVDFTNYSSLNDAAFTFKLNKASDRFFSYHNQDLYDDVNKDNLKEGVTTDAIIYTYSDGSMSDVFVPIEYFFEFVESNNTTNYPYFKPRHTAYLGMYDFILYFDGEGYQIYCYRHYNITVKVYLKNPTHGDSSGEGYAIPDESSLLWSRQTFVGSYANTQDLGSTGAGYGSFVNDISFEDAMKNYFAKNMNEGEIYYVRDHVTGIDLFSIQKSNGVVEVKNEVSNFKIRKNYLLYIAGPYSLGN